MTRPTLINIYKKRNLYVIYFFLFFLICPTLFGFKSKNNHSPHSQTVPKGMKMVWSDEFNDHRLDTTKWFTHYYSTLDFYYRTNFNDFQANNLPQPAIEFTDSTLILRTNDQIPERSFWESGRKISSIQTYDWNSNRNLLDNKRGGYFEARIRRSVTPDAEMANSAFWFDSPGPDLRYYIEQGNHACGVDGIRPCGQVFEIDLCEYITTEIVMHGNVSAEGKFEHNIGHFIIPGEFNGKWTKHGMLWSAAGLKFYVDDKLVAESWNPHDIKSPNHTMNMFFGAYGKGGEVTMEVDYVRYYQWEMEEGNEIPNPGFEYQDDLFPWEGNGVVTKAFAHSGKNGVLLNEANNIYQYIYLDHSKEYQLGFMSKGPGTLKVKIENITLVNGTTKSEFTREYKLTSDYTKHSLHFFTETEYDDHMCTVKVSFINESDKETPIYLDDIEIVK